MPLKYLYKEDKFYLLVILLETIFQVILCVPGALEEIKYAGDDLFLNIFIGTVIGVIVMFSITTKYRKNYELWLILLASLLDILIPVGAFIPHIIVVVFLIKYWKTAIFNIKDDHDLYEQNEDLIEEDKERRDSMKDGED